MIFFLTTLSFTAFIKRVKIRTSMNGVKILWADDEIDLLKPHILFLEQKGYQVLTATNGQDAVTFLEHEKVDIVFLDENMPGISGLDALAKIKAEYPSIPVVMITKSEEEELMEEAIGSQISDYLIKPVNPKQILLSIKKNLDDEKLISEKTSMNYQQEFNELSGEIARAANFEDWSGVYRKLVNWELKLEKLPEEGMLEILRSQKEEANQEFFRFVERHYESWVNNPVDGDPILSPDMIANLALPEAEDAALFVILVDNLRYDQWKVMEPHVNRYFNKEAEGFYMSILPTATDFPMNSLLSGMMPSELEDVKGKLWFTEEETNIEGSELIKLLLSEEELSLKYSFTKVSQNEEGKKLPQEINKLMNNDLNVIIYNFVDTLGHSKTEMEIIKELADDESAFRSLINSWFEHSPLLDAIKEIARLGGKLLITSDHGSIRVSEASKVIGDRNTNTNLRYKQGKNLDFQQKDVMMLKDPSNFFLPKPNVSTRYIFARPNKFFVYPNNLNHFVNYFKNTFQHGGVSMEEMMVPFALYSAKS